MIWYFTLHSFADLNFDPKLSEIVFLVCHSWFGS